jgi:hypothetical protein
MENRRKTSLSIFAFFRLFPVANIIFLACLSSFVAFNGAMILLWSFDPFLPTKWLAASEPMTNKIGNFLPLVRLTTESLERNNGRELIPAVRNLLSFNFVLFTLFPIPIVLASFLHLRSDASIVVPRASKLIFDTGRSPFIFIVGALFFALLILLILFGPVGGKAYVIDLRLDYICFGILFFGGDLTFCLAAVLLLLASFGLHVDEQHP